MRPPSCLGRVCAGGSSFKGGGGLRWTAQDLSISEVIRYTIKEGASGHEPRKQALKREMFLLEK